jgi:aspartyl-tRNA(Asn)/glutamyl-tRNA(Gln) amidotransferase subunit A
MAFAQMNGRREAVDESSVPLSDFRLAVISGWGEDLDTDTSSIWARLTAGVPSIDFPSRAILNEIGFTVLLAEAAAFHRRWLETVPERYGKDVLEPLQRGLEVTRAEYVAALIDQSRLRVQANEAMEAKAVDALMVPATTIVAPRLTDRFERQDLTGYTRPFNTTGQPVVCLPVATGDLPIGMQVVGRHGADLKLLQIARAVEREWARVD